MAGTRPDRRRLLATLAGTGVLLPLAARAAPLPPPPKPLTIVPAAWTGAERIPIWPGPAPGDADFRALPVPSPWPPVFLRNTRTPALHLFRPDRSNGRAVLVMPGGGYEFVSIANEGVDVAARLCPLGYSVFVLEYRLPAEGWRERADVPLQDAQRAIRLLKSQASTYGIDPKRVSVIGFSAGGHLAASLATGYAERVYAAEDAADRLDARPAAVGLIYPVISMDAAITHAGSRQHLLGETPDAAVVARRSAELNVDGQTPPLFLVHACDDPAVPVENSIRMFEAARRAHVPVEAHFIQEGGHAFGVGIAGTPSSLWMPLFELWAARALGG